MIKCHALTVTSNSFLLTTVLLINILTCSFPLANMKYKHDKGDIPMEKETTDSFDDEMIAKYNFDSWKDTVEGETIHFHKGFVLETFDTEWTISNKELETNPVPFISSDAKYWLEHTKIKNKKILITILICESNQIAHQTVFSSLKYISHPNPVLDPPEGWSIGDVYKCGYWARGNVYVAINDLSEPQIDKSAILTINKKIDSLLTNRPILADEKSNSFSIQCKTDTLIAQSMVEVLINSIDTEDCYKYHFIYTGGRITLKNNTFYYAGYESGKHSIELFLTDKNGETLMSKCHITVMKY